MKCRDQLRDNGWCILDYSEENLAKSLCTDHQYLLQQDVIDRAHYDYLLSYFRATKPLTILIEKNYVSKAFLSDYSNFYSTSFQDYERKCIRVHFFRIEISNFDRLFEFFRSDNGEIDESYLGHIVVKPLPDSLIGPTLLANYEKKVDSKIRHFPACRQYPVNILGKQFIVESLAYQEQDTAVAACASVAIWSAFHKTSHLFGTPLPSPSEITKMAGVSLFNHGRIFPNQGLDNGQVCAAIRYIGLEPEIVISKDFKGDVTLARRMVYAYLRAGIPVLLFFSYRNETPNQDCDEDDEYLEDDEPGHLITITGYSEPEKRSDYLPKEEISLGADTIEKFYAHDDQVGPFARMQFNGNTAVKTPGGETADIYSIIMPVYPKIRTKFQNVFERVSKIDILFFENKIFKFELIWDIFLISNNDYKQELLKMKISDEAMRISIQKNYPKFIWVARAIVYDEKIFDLIFDSTDTVDGSFCIHLNLLDLRLKNHIHNDFFKKFEDYLKPVFGRRFIKNILEELSI